jgi:NTE family protein
VCLLRAQVCPGLYALVGVDGPLTVRGHISEKGVAMPDGMAAQADAITLDSSAARGYTRSLVLQERFEAAAAQLLTLDGYTPPTGGEARLIADLALEGGGVKGIGLVGAILVLEEAGYQFRAVAGTSAGAIVASLVTALVKGGAAFDRDGPRMLQLKKWLDELDFNQFMPEDRFQHFLHHSGGDAGQIAAHIDSLMRHMGLYDGDFLYQWLTPKLEACGVSTFGDLKMHSPEDIAALPAGHGYTLLVHTSDITRGWLARLPWDCPNYGIDPDRQSVAEAVRASMSIPFFFDPVTIDAATATVQLAGPGGESIPQTFEAGTVTWVDGGMLRNFPITAFDRVDDKPPRWPTIGIKLSAFQADVGPTDACDNAIAVAVRCLKTMMNEWDTYEVDDTTAARTIFVDHGTGITATKFDLSQADKDLLFLNGVRAATEFVIANAGAGVPRNAQQAQDRLTRGHRSTSQSTGAPAASPQR